MHTKIIELMRVPGTQCLYVLGCFGRHITLYSQQVRAINLAYSLNKIREFKGTRIGVVGAGAAGLTFTVAAARLGAEVVLLEKLPVPMGIQRGSGKRFVHPHIFDWPAEHSDRYGADLPFLDWGADFAEKVVEQIEKKWIREREFLGRAIEAHWDVQDVNLEADTSGGNITLTWNDIEPHGEEFDIVVLAVGFGLEKDFDQNQSRYWEDDSYSRVNQKKMHFLIDGCGDSALTDLMRLCIRDFQHDRIVNLCAQNPESRRSAKYLQGLEEEYLRTGNVREISKFFNQLNIEPMKMALKPMIRSDTGVYLTAKSWNRVYSPNSCILNRIIASQLAKLGAWRFKAGPITVPKSRNKDGKFEVTFEQAKETKHFDEMLIRHGPTSVLASEFGRIHEACGELQERWKNLPQHLDQTRVPLDWGDCFSISIRTATPTKKRELIKPVRMVAFDLDGTLLQEEGIIWSWKLVWRFLKFDDWVRSEMMNRYLNEVRHKTPTWYKDWCDESADLFREKGLKRDDFAEITRNLNVIGGLKETIRELKSNNIRLVIISGGIDVFLEEKVPDWRELFDEVHINRFIFDKDKVFRRIESTPFDFVGKRTCIENICRDRGWLHNQVVFVGDGFNDEKVMGFVGKVIGFNATASVVENNADVNIKSNDLRSILPEIL